MRMRRSQTNPTGQLTATATDRHQIQQRRCCTFSCVYALTDQRGEIRRQSNDLPHGESFAGSVRRLRIRFQFPDRIFNDRLSVEDFRSHRQLSWAKGKHFIKFGFETRWIQLNQGTSQSGTLTYNSPAAFQNNSMGSATYTAILPLVRQRKTQYFGLRAGRMESDRQPDDHGRSPL